MPTLMIAVLSPHAPEERGASVPARICERIDRAAAGILGRIPSKASRRERRALVMLENLNKMYGTVSIARDHRLTIRTRRARWHYPAKENDRTTCKLINQTARARCDIIVVHSLITVSRKCE